MKLLTNPLVVMSLALLLGVGSGLGVFWREAKALAAAVHHQRVAAKEAVRPEKPWDFWTVEIENLANELKGRRTALDSREQEIAAREERLNARFRELEKLRQEIETLRAEALSGMTDFDAAEARNLKTLAKTYGELTPKAAVGIFEKLDEATAVKLLYLMKSEAVSGILQEMGTSSNPETVARAARLIDRLRLVKAPKAS